MLAEPKAQQWQTRMQDPGRVANRLPSTQIQRSSKSTQAESDTVWSGRVKGSGRKAARHTCCVASVSVQCIYIFLTSISQFHLLSPSLLCVQRRRRQVSPPDGPVRLLARARGRGKSGKDYGCGPERAWPVLRTTYVSYSVG